MKAAAVESIARMSGRIMMNAVFTIIGALLIIATVCNPGYALITCDAVKSRFQDVH